MNQNFLEFNRVMQLEATAIQACVNRHLNHATAAQTIHQAIELLFTQSKKGGKVLVLGIGKSGKIASKIAATLSSTGTPALYIHPTEALHGDLGFVTESDIAIAISYTGNTEELLTLMPYFSSRSVPVIGIGGNPHSKLAEKCSFWIDANVSEEACSHNLAPTSSTTLTLAIGDAIAMSLMKRRAFTAEDFAKNHPGGSLGRRLQLKVKDLMHPLSRCPIANENASMETILSISTEKRLGAVLIVEGKVIKGIITDGDIRRALSHQAKFFTFKANEVMTANPISVTENTLAADALRVMEDRPSQISVLPVISEAGEVCGVLRIHDLAQAL